MDNEIKSWLYDILNTINEIERFYIDQKKEFAVYQIDFRKKKEELKEILK